MESAGKKGKGLWTSIESGDLKHAEQELWRVLNHDAPMFVEKMKSPAFQRKLVRYLRREVDPAYGPPIFSRDHYGRDNIGFDVHKTLDGEEWLRYPTPLGERLSDSVESVLSSDAYHKQRIKMPGFYTVSIVRDVAGKTTSQIWQDFKKGCVNLLPNTQAELACILKAIVPQDQWKMWGIETVVVLHESFLTNRSVRSFLAIDTNFDMLSTFDGREGDIFPHKNRIAVAILKSIEVHRGDAFPVLR